LLKLEIFIISLEELKILLIIVKFNSLSLLPNIILTAKISYPRFDSNFESLINPLESSKCMRNPLLFKKEEFFTVIYEFLR
jgi:hypothetical protein